MYNKVSKKLDQRSAAWSQTLTQWQDILYNDRLQYHEYEGF